MSVFLGRFGGKFHVDGLASPRQILNVIKSDVEHEADEQHSTTGLDHVNHARADGLAPNPFYQGQQDVPAVQNRDGEHIEHSQVNIHEDTKPDCQAPALLAVKEAVVNVHDFHGAAEVLRFDIRMPGEERAKSLEH